mmetsp:Transcript_70709/g.165822  ORF Transcript_70709/g.165822 Transcript_70709/m.165822 type:complete len:212 (-) Transcript_70709:372-1007(-)
MSKLRPEIVLPTDRDRFLCYPESLLTNTIVHMCRCYLAQCSGLSTLVTRFAEAFQSFLCILPPINTVATCKAHFRKLLQGDALHVSIIGFLENANRFLCRLLRFLRVSKSLLGLGNKQQRPRLSLISAALMQRDRLVCRAKGLRAFLARQARSNHGSQRHCLTRLVTAFSKEGYCLSANLASLLLLLFSKAYLCADGKRGRLSCLPAPLCQ